MNSGSAATLYASRQFILSPEEYEINGDIANASSATANQLLMFARNSYSSERFGLDNWPLFNIGDGGGNANVESDSLLRVQVFGAIAYGSRGQWLVVIFIEVCASPAEDNGDPGGQAKAW